MKLFYKLQRGETNIDSQFYENRFKAMPLCRELQEESGLIASTEDLQFQGQLQYEMSDKIWESSLYTCTKFIGNPTECDEMKPTWFDLADIPYDKMYKDVQYWMPIVLKNLQESEEKMKVQFQSNVVALTDDSRLAKSVVIKRITKIELFDLSMSITCDPEPILSVNAENESANK